jgi:hypothetical protein
MARISCILQRMKEALHVHGGPYDGETIRMLVPEDHTLDSGQREITEYATAPGSIPRFVATYVYEVTRDPLGKRCLRYIGERTQ